MPLELREPRQRGVELGLVGAPLIHGREELVAALDDRDVPAFGLRDGRHRGPLIRRQRVQAAAQLLCQPRLLHLGHAHAHPRRHRVEGIPGRRLREVRGDDRLLRVREPAECGDRLHLGLGARSGGQPCDEREVALEVGTELGRACLLPGQRAIVGRFAPRADPVPEALPCALAIADLSLRPVRQQHRREVPGARDRSPVLLRRVLGDLAQRGELLTHLVDPVHRPCLGGRRRRGRRRRWTGRRRRGGRGRLLLGARSRRRLAVLANPFGDLSRHVLVRAGVGDLHELQGSQPVVALLLVTDVFGSQPSVDASDQPVALLADHCGRCSAAGLEQLLVDRGVSARLGSGDAVGGLLSLVADLVLRLGVRLVDCGVLMLLRELDLPVLVERRGVEVVEIDAGLSRDEVDGSRRPRRSLRAGARLGRGRAARTAETSSDTSIRGRR